MTVYRTGTFSVAAPEAEGKCGVFGKTEFRYDVWFTATAEDLDARGFIIDNADLHRYFQELYGPGQMPFVSCEKMGLRAISDYRRHWPTARAITVRIWGKEDITYVESRWTREQ